MTRKQLIRTSVDIFLTILVGSWMLWLFLGVPAAQVTAGGWAQKIFYLHVPSATIAFMGFLVVAGLSVAVLFGDSDYWDIRMSAVLEVSYVFTTVVLLTGPFWAKPVWGIWWRWEPRMTTFFILWIMYGSWFLLRNAVPAGRRRQIYSAIYALLAFFNVPVVWVSINFWKPEHQLHPRKIDLETSMQLTLYASFSVMILLFVRLIWLRLELAKLRENFIHY